MFLCTLVLLAGGLQGNSFVWFPNICVKQCLCDSLFAVVPASASIYMSVVDFNL